MLLNTFFKILSTSKDEEKTVVRVELEKDHKIYEGHFPGNPVVPGVCLIQMIREGLEVVLDKKLRLFAADEIKFLHIVNPLTANLLTLEIKNRPNAGNPLAFNIMITDGQVTYLKMKAEFCSYQ
jgi:3-hydroxyacyl-[acyl-carrier-protein] dehydratase